MLICAMFVVAPRTTRAADKLEMRLSSTLLGGKRQSVALAFSRPAIDLMGRHLSQRTEINFDIFQVSDPCSLDELEKLGEKLARGDYHFAVLWGSEYGWLKRNRSDLKLEPLVIADVGGGATNISLLVPDRLKNVKLADLRGKKLVVWPSLMVDCSLDLILRKNGLDSNGFFQRNDKKELYRTPRDVVLSVKNGEADCLMIDFTAWNNLKNSDLDLTKEFVNRGTGPDLPGPVFVGRRNNLRNGQWRELQTQFETLGKSLEGKQSLVFWRVQGFKRPDRSFEDQADACSLQFEQHQRRAGGKEK